jgi:hypothetical protein
MTREEKIALVQRQLDAYNRRALEDFVACFHPEVWVRRLRGEQLMMEGRDVFRARYGELFAGSPALRCELRSRIVLDDVVVDEEWVTGSARAPQGIHTVAIYAFRDGLIDRVWFPG